MQIILIYNVTEWGASIKNPCVQVINTPHKTNDTLALGSIFCTDTSLLYGIYSCLNLKIKKNGHIIINVTSSRLILVVMLFLSAKQRELFDDRKCSISCIILVSGIEI